MHRRRRTTDDPARHAQALRWQVGGDLHEQLVEAIYAEAARSPTARSPARRTAALRPGPHARPDRHQPAVGLPDHDAAVRGDVLAHHHRRQRALGHAVASLLVDTVYPLAARRLAAGLGCPGG